MPSKCELHRFLPLAPFLTTNFQTDFGERIPHASVKFHDGSDPMRMHNSYAVVYNEMVFNLLRERFGEGEAVVFARSSAAGGQRCVAISYCTILLYFKAAD
jgi:alpha-glucosidase (family GH31 glycosyl hydrolase)